MTQGELEFVATAKERERILREFDLKGRKNRILMASILREIAKYPAGKCYISQATFGQMFKVAERTIQRALRDLRQLDLIAVGRSARSFDGEVRTINHYSINWTELKRRTNTTVEPTNTTVTSTNTTVEPTNTTARCRPIERRLTRETTTTREQPVVVVSLLELGVAKAEEAYRTAKAHFSEAEISERIQAFRELPTPEQNPGKLYNWLTMPRSFRSGEQVLRLRPGLEPDAERYRAELIQHGKRKGWSFATLQAAVIACENKLLNKGRHQWA